MVRRGSEGEEGAESEEGCGGRLPTASKFGTSFGGPYFGKPVFFLLIFFFPKKTKITDRYYNHAVRFDVQSSGSDRDIAGRQAGATAGNMCIPRIATHACPEDVDVDRTSHSFVSYKANF